MAFPAHVWSQLRNCTADDLISALMRDGWDLDTASGSARVFRRRTSPPRHVSIHWHPKKTYGPKMLQALLADIGWSEADLRRLKLIK
jgi:predicted RNA binding protein YcfA (HicA-like mRNA interferase family)